MANFKTSIDVAANQEVAFAYLADFTNSTEWDPGVVAASRVGDAEAPIGVGTEFDIAFMFYGREIKLRYRITEFEAPNRVVLDASSKRASARDEITIVAAAKGSTVTYDAMFSLGGFLKVFDRGLQVAFDSTGGKAAKGIEKALAGQASS